MKRKYVLPANGAMASLARANVNQGAGWRPIPSPSLHLTSTPAEDLHTSQVRPSCAQRARKTKITWRFGTWNVRSLLDAEGPVETARRGIDAWKAEDRRADLVVRELDRYNMKVVGLQETKWFGEAVYQVGESVVIGSGRPVLASEECGQRGEGVDIQAWRAAGQQWKAWSPRQVSPCLQTGRRKADHIHVLSCYAPTRAASREVKDEFFAKLQQALAAVPPDEMYIILGDFNAHVGSQDESDDPWGGVRGPHGFEGANDAGKELVSFLSINGATVCNTWFKKRDIQKQTWQHSKSKQWHCKDYVIMRRRRCLDVTVKRGAECNTDHQLVCLKFKVSGSYHHRRSTPPSQLKRFDVAKLDGGRDEACEVSPRVTFQQVVDTASASWPDLQVKNGKQSDLHSSTQLKQS